MTKKVLLCILDGWGVGEKNKNNAIHIAKTKNFDYLVILHIPYSRCRF